MSQETGVQVLVRVRPSNPSLDPNSSSINSNASANGLAGASTEQNHSSVQVDEPSGSVYLERKQKDISHFTFSGVMGPNAMQEDVYSKCKLVSDVVEGINCCVMAYGQTSSGKTYTMYGQGWEDPRAAPAHGGGGNSPVKERRSISDEAAAIESAAMAARDAADGAPTASNSGTNNGSMNSYARSSSGSLSGPQSAAVSPMNGLSHRRGSQVDGEVASSLHGENIGIIPKSVSDLFDELENRSEMNEKYDFSVNCQVMQIYNEKIFDLLQDKRRENPLQLRECVRGAGMSVQVKGMSVYRVYSKDDVMSLLRQGLRNRVMRATELNQESSRCHTILQLFLQVEEEDALGIMVLKRSTFSLVDLAGSEKWRAGLDGMRNSLSSTNLTSSLSAQSSVAQQLESMKEQKEMVNINTSLHVLGTCVSALIEPNRKHIPYRNSLLTRLLQDALGGNGKTILIATIHEDPAYKEETYSTLTFASRASRIKMSVTQSVESIDGLTLVEANRQIALLRAKLREYTATLKGMNSISSDAEGGSEDDVLNGGSGALVGGGQSSLTKRQINGKESRRNSKTIVNSPSPRKRSNSVSNPSSGGVGGLGKCKLCGSLGDELNVTKKQLAELVDENISLKELVELYATKYGALTPPPKTGIAIAPSINSSVELNLNETIRIQSARDGDDGEILLGTPLKEGKHAKEGKLTLMTPGESLDGLAGGPPSAASSGIAGLGLGLGLSPIKEATSELSPNSKQSTMMAMTMKSGSIGASVASISGSHDSSGLVSESSGILCKTELVEHALALESGPRDGKQLIGSAREAFDAFDPVKHNLIQLNDSGLIHAVVLESPDLTDDQFRKILSSSSVEIAASLVTKREEIDIAQLTAEAQAQKLALVKRMKDKDREAGKERRASHVRKMSKSKEVEAMADEDLPTANADVCESTPRISAEVEEREQSADDSADVVSAVSMVSGTVVECASTDDVAAEPLNATRLEKVSRSSEDEALAAKTEAVDEHADSGGTEGLQNDLIRSCKLSDADKEDKEEAEVTKGAGAAAARLPSLSYEEVINQLAEASSNLACEQCLNDCVMIAIVENIQYGNVIEMIVDTISRTFNTASAELILQCVDVVVAEISEKEQRLVKKAERSERAAVTAMEAVIEEGMEEGMEEVDGDLKAVLSSAGRPRRSMTTDSEEALVDAYKNEIDTNNPTADSFGGVMYEGVSKIPAENPIEIAAINVVGNKILDSKGDESQSPDLKKSIELTSTQQVFATGCPKHGLSDCILCKLFGTGGMSSLSMQESSMSPGRSPVVQKDAGQQQVLPQPPLGALSVGVRSVPASGTASNSGSKELGFGFGSPGKMKTMAGATGGNNEGLSSQSSAVSQQWEQQRLQQAMAYQISSAGVPQPSGIPHPHAAVVTSHTRAHPAEAAANHVQTIKRLQKQSLITPYGDSPHPPPLETAASSFMHSQSSSTLANISQPTTNLNHFKLSSLRGKGAGGGGEGPIGGSHKVLDESTPLHMPVSEGAATSSPVSSSAAKHLDEQAVYIQQLQRLQQLQKESMGSQSASAVPAAFNQLTNNSVLGDGGAHSHAHHRSVMQAHQDLVAQLDGGMHHPHHPVYGVGILSRTLTGGLGDSAKISSNDHVHPNSHGHAGGGGGAGGGIPDGQGYSGGDLSVPISSMTITGVAGSHIGRRKGFDGNLSAAGSVGVSAGGSLGGKGHRYDRMAMSDSEANDGIEGIDGDSDDANGAPLRSQLSNVSYVDADGTVHGSNPCPQPGGGGKNGSDNTTAKKAKKKEKDENGGRKPANKKRRGSRLNQLLGRGRGGSGPGADEGEGGGRVRGADEGTGIGRTDKSAEPNARKHSELSAVRRKKSAAS